jgi:low affinity Fe/Cu permease
MEAASSFVIRLTSSNMALLCCFIVVILWIIDGFFAHFSQQWESLIGTVSGVITVLMLFLLQKAQFKDSLAIQLKLNELVAAHELASNRLVDVEGMSEEELRVLQKYYSKLSKFAKEQDTLTESHSIDEKHKEHAIHEEMEQELQMIGDNKMIGDNNEP